MDLQSRLLLNEDVVASMPEPKRSEQILSWLLNLDQLLVELQTSEVKAYQKQLVDQLVRQIQQTPGPPARTLIGRALANLFSIGDPFLLFDTVNLCNEILKNRDDSPSYLPTKLASVTCIGSLYEKLGRLMGRSYEETVILLLKTLKNAESQLRCEIYSTLKKILAGMGGAASALHRDVFKAIKHGLADRVSLVRCNAIACLKEMLNYASFLYTTEVENVFSLSFRALDASNYESRRAISKLLGHLVAITQQASGQPNNVNNSKSSRSPPSLDEVLTLLSAGFVRGNLGGFLKTAPSEMIKGPSSVSKEIRIGIAYSYIEIVDQLGCNWFERHFTFYVKHLLDLLTNLKTNTTHMDAVFSRRCIFFILHSLCKRLSEKAQLNAIKSFSTIICKYKTESIGDSNDLNSIASKETVTQADLHQHVLICMLLQMGCIFDDLGTCASNLINDASLKLIETSFELLIHPVNSVRVAAAWSLRCMAVSCPNQLTVLIDQCVDKLEKNKNTLEIISGYSLGLSALIGAAIKTPLGIPHNRGKIVFCIAEELLRSATMNSRLSLQRTQAGWQLISALMTLGHSVVKGLLPRLLLIWKNSFSKSSKDLESEKARGDAFTWQITLESRAGALCAMSTFLQHNASLINDETLQRLMGPIDFAILMLNSFSSLFKTFGPVVKASAALVRLRLYETLLQLPPATFESNFSCLLRLLVSEFTLAENAANTSTSMLSTFCYTDDYVLLGSWSQETDQRFIEDQLQPSNANGSGALEHDLACLYQSFEEGQLIPSQLPLGVTVINRSCQLFAHCFKWVATKHRLQMFAHFQECIKHSKVVRQEAIQINVVTTIIGALKSLAEQKAPLGGEEIKKTCLAIVIPILTHTSPLLRVAAAHALGRLCQVINDGRFVSEMAGICFEKLKSARDMLSRTGYSLAIGYLHRFVGSLGSQANLNSAISILLALSQDLNSPVVQIWSLHSLSLVVDSGGPIFRPYIEATMHHSIKLLINASYLNSDVHQCAGRVLSALITAIGPELQEELDQIVAMRNQLLMASLLMQTHPDELVQVQAIGCLQQLHMFAAGQISLSRLVPALCSVICSEQLLLRSASINCLYQLAQRETNEVYVQANEWIRRMRPNESWAEHGLPGLLFDRLDKETQPKLCDRLRNVLSSLLQCLCAKRLNKVILLCKEVLTNAEHRPTTHQNGNDPENDDDEDDEIGFQSNDAVQQSIRCPKWATKVFATQMLCRVIYYCVNSSNARLHFDLAAARDAQRKSLTSSVLNQSGDPSDSGNFEFESCSIEANFLILHLSDLIRMAFMAATSDSDALRLEGLTLLELVIDKFAKVAEPEFSDHVVLEQYQAQVGAALRPAFAAETASHVTAKACQVCSAWIGSGVARDLNDLRRVYQLLVSSLLKLKRDSNSRLYNESASTMEKLAILKAWAEVYIVAMRKRRQCSESRFSYIRDQLFDDKPLTEEERVVYEGELDDNENLLQLVKPELDCLSKNWLNALKDHALLTLPIEFDGQLPHDGGAFYTPEIVEVVRVYYRKSWPFILHSVCLWLCSSGFDDEMLQINGHASNTKKDEGDEDEETLKLKLDDEHDKRKLFYLILGVAMESLCNPKSNEPMIYILTCLQSLETLFSHDFTQKLLGQDKKLCVELCNVLHRLLITRESIDCQLVILSISHLVYLAQMDVENVKRCRSNRDNSMDSTEVENEAKEEEETSSEGEDNATEIAQEKMELQNGQSLCYTLAEIALCVLVRQIPEVSLTLANTPGLTGLGNFNALTRSVGQPRDTSEQNGRLIGSAILLLSKLPLLCSPATSPLLLPTILYLLSNVFRYSGHTNESDATAFGMTSASDGVHLKTKKLIYEKEPVTSLLCAFEYLAACPYTRNPLCSQNWIQLLQSCLANILDFCKSCDDEPRPDQISVLYLISIFILKATKEVLQPANLQFPCINMFKHSIESPDETVQLKTFEVLRLIFSHSVQHSIVPFIHSLAPRMIQIVNSEIDNSICDKLTKNKYNLVLVGLEVLETLVRSADKNFSMFALYIHLLVKLLIDDLSQCKTRPFSALLHSFALQKLISIGPLYPNEFKQIMSNSPTMKARLESAIKSNRVDSSSTDSSRSFKSDAISSSSGQATIKLKTDFSNFVVR